MKFKGLLDSEQFRHNAIFPALLGLFFGLMPTTGDAFSIIAILAALIYLVAFGNDTKITLGVFAIAQYLAVQIAINQYHIGFAAPEDYEKTLIMFLILLLPISYFIQSLNLELNKTQNFIKIGIFASFIMLLTDYYFGHLFVASPELRNMCRVNVFSGNPQWSAAALMMVVLPLLALRLSGRSGMRITDMAVIIFTIISIGAFMGARMAFYALLIILVIFAFDNAIKARFFLATKIILVSLLGILLMVVIDIASNCSFSGRVGVQFETYSKFFNIERQVNVPIPAVPQVDASGPTTPVEPAPQPAEIAPVPTDAATQIAIMGAGGSRIELWKIAIAAVAEQPWFGYGHAAEAKIVAQNIPGTNLIHVHNQFLSWLLWGGVVGLCSGLILLVSPMFIMKNRLAGVAFSLGWLFMSVSESFFWLPMNLAWLIFGVLIYERICECENAEAHGPATMPNKSSAK